jgi:tetratricopeptide (TPR) repeat protein
MPTMGRGDPLDDPELDAIDRCLDDLDLTGAQERLARLGPGGEHADVAPYFVARLLFLKGKLDQQGVVERLREVLARVGYFPRAAALLYEAEAGFLLRPEGLPPPSSPLGPGLSAAPMSPAPTTRVRTPPDSAWAAPSTSPEPHMDGEPETHREIERRFAPTEPRQPMAPVVQPSGPVEPLRRRVRSYTPVGGMDAVKWASELPAPAFSQYPEIPRGPRVPAFESNRAPPSYRPGEESIALEPPHTKRALPTDAGRYSQRPNLREVTHDRRGQPHRAGPLSGPKRERLRDPRRDPSAPPDPPSTRQSAPPRAVDRGQAAPGLPPLLELTVLVDQGQFVRVIATINRAAPDIPPEYALLRCRALAGAGYTDQAFDALAELIAIAEIPVEVRAGAARLFVELGEPEQGLRHAIEALQQDAESRLSRLTYALAAIRCARRKPDDALLVKAERALETFRGGRAGPHAAITLALQACVLSGLGEAERALQAAERALTFDPHSVDALSAIVEASTALGREAEARGAWKRLAGLAPDEADVLLTRHPALGAEVAAAVPDPGSFEPWDAVEIAVAHGSRSSAMEAVEKLAEEYVARMSKGASQSGLAAMATVASAFLTRAPVLSAFAPFDLSLWSIERIEAALDVLYGKEPRPRLRTDEGALRLLVGSYLGEAIRIAREGRWEGRLAELQKAKVLVGEQYWYPFQAVSARLHSGGRSRLVDGLRGALALRGSAPWQSTVPNPVSPPIPWGQRAWPLVADIGRVGRSVMHSPLSVFSGLSGHGALDLSLGSLAGIDAYLELLCPVGAPVDRGAAWALRASAFAGGYVGEVLRELVGGTWEPRPAPVQSPSEFVLVLADRLEAHPVDRIRQRLAGEHYETTADYVGALARRVARAPGRR